MLKASPWLTIPLLLRPDNGSGASNPFRRLVRVGFFRWPVRSGRYNRHLSFDRVNCADAAAESFRRFKDSSAGR
jgi:hypothetical protein